VCEHQFKFRCLGFEVFLYGVILSVSYRKSSSYDFVSFFNVAYVHELHKLQLPLLMVQRFVHGLLQWRLQTIEIKGTKSCWEEGAAHLCPGDGTLIIIIMAYVQKFTVSKKCDYLHLHLHLSVLSALPPHVCISYRIYVKFTIKFWDGQGRGGGVTSCPFASMGTLIFRCYRISDSVC